MERYFERSFASLAALFLFLDEVLGTAEVSESESFAIRLALEELFTNIVKYSTSSARDVSVQLDVRDGELVIVLTDFDAEPFDPTTHPEPDLNAPLRERRPGGLGLFLARNVVDSIDHAYVDRKNIITLCKKVGE